ncbi:GNAT family N-acetyltransferase [Kitasatospora sp. NPDC096147]|uniref:GNAT family N-acetyltransferase n=1 Tax=Kitasatospora sp. NPDC096147 TaxID=3364093 RepID=UPI00382B173E
MQIRTARTEELPLLQEIEVAAGRLFAGIGMDEVASDDPIPLDRMAAHQRAGLAWVALDPDDGAPVGYLLAEPLDGYLHVEQVSVHPDHGRRGIGRALIDRAATHAAAEGLPALTLTTFTDVPWNAPYYARLGFHTVPDTDLTPGQRTVREAEAAHGLDRWPRQVMIREL